jgi:phenylalanyl-tRNA synthetase beta chain
MDAMSHLGVAKDVCAYISHHYKKGLKVVSPFKNTFKPDNNSRPFQIEIKDAQICERYAGLSISGITIGDSPDWLKNKLRAIGLRPLNNVVDITNFILHETGQPLHAFDADKITDNKIIVQTLAEGTSFTTLDEKERKLSNADIMICNGASDPMCIAGVFGGLQSGITSETKNLFLESAVFHPAFIRKTMLRHNLRTDAAIRFEKGIDISNTVNVLKRAALLIKEIAGGKISSAVTDVYPVEREKKEVILSNHYLKKISGKNYHPDTVINVLKSLNFQIIREGIDEIQVAVPFTNPDISLAADVIEEIMRIDGLDNIEIPDMIKMAPATDAGLPNALQKEKIASWLTGNGFHEIFTNSITNSKYFKAETLAGTVKIMNSLSEDLDVMRPEMLPTGLEAIAYNINRKNNSLLFFEFGKTYSDINGSYKEKENLALYFTGNTSAGGWNSSVKKADIYFAKGTLQTIFSIAGIENISFRTLEDEHFEEYITAAVNGSDIAFAGKVKRSELETFSIKQPVYFGCIDWANLLSLAANRQISFEPIARFPQVQRDLSMLIDRQVPYSEVENLVKSLQFKKLQQVQLFDVFESEKLGQNKKSLAINLTFLDKEKTLTDKETEHMMNAIISILENKLNAVIRRNA